MTIAMTKAEKVKKIEMGFDMIAAAVRNRCYRGGNVEAMRRLERWVRRDMDDIRDLLAREAEAQEGQSC